jgi:hypothetical protein
MALASCVELIEFIRRTGETVSLLAGETRIFRDILGISQCAILA